jgi:Protein of unknown function (DUF935)
MFGAALNWAAGLFGKQSAPAQDAGDSVRLPAGKDYSAGSAPGPDRGILDRLKRQDVPWPGPDVAADTDAGPYVGTERYRGGPQGVVFPRFLPYYEDGSLETAEMRLAYRRMGSDPNVSAAIKGLIYAVAALDLKVVPANRKSKYDQEVADFVRWNLEDRLFEGMSGLVWNILSGGLTDGYSLCYKVWGCEKRGKHAGKWPLCRLKPVDTGNDAVVQTNSAMDIVGILGLRYNAGTEFSPNEFVIYRHCPVYNQPTGTSALRCVYKRWWFLNAVMTLRGIATEKRSSPFAWATYKTASQESKLNAMMAKLKSQNWATVPEGVLLQVLDLAGSGETIFQSFCKDAAEDIFLGIQHATLQALTGGANEERGSSEIHKHQTDVVREYLTRGIETCLNDHDTGLIRDIVDLNFVVEDYPRALLTSVDKDGQKKEADLAKQLQDMGLKLSVADMYDRFSLTPPEDESDVLQKEQPPAPGQPPGAPGEQPPGQPGETAPGGEGGAEFDLGDDSGAEGAGEQQPAQGETFAEEDWTSEQGPRGGTKWTNRKTQAIAYGPHNPDAGVHARKPGEEEESGQRQAKDWDSTHSIKNGKLVATVQLPKTSTAAHKEALDRIAKQLRESPDLTREQKLSHFNKAVKLVSGLSEQDAKRVKGVEASKSGKGSTSQESGGRGPVAQESGGRGTREQPVKPEEQPGEAATAPEVKPTEPEPESGERAGGEPDAGTPAEPGGPVAEEAGQPSVPEFDQAGIVPGEPASGTPPESTTATRATRTAAEVNRHIERYESFFRTKGQHGVADWMRMLRDHVNSVGVESALAELGEEAQGDYKGKVQYQGAAVNSPVYKTMNEFAGHYLDRNGVIPLAKWGAGTEASKKMALVSSSTMIENFVNRTKDFAGADFVPHNPTYKNKLEEARQIPGLESSEDIGDVVGKPVTNMTEDVIAKLDEKYGAGQWIAKCYNDDAGSGFGVYFPQRIGQIRQDAQNLIWTAGENIAQHGFTLDRDNAGKIKGIKHKGGDVYDFGTDKFESTIHGDVRQWCDKLMTPPDLFQAQFSGGALGEHKGDVSGSAIDNEHGASLPQGENGDANYMVCPAFKAVGVSEADRASGKTIAPGEARLHIMTRNGKVEAIPHTTWIKGEPLPVVFETEDTKAMAKAVEEALSKLPEENRNGQLYAPDIIKTPDGYKVVELNFIDEGGGSGYLRNNPFIIDSFVSHMTGRDPAHVRFIRDLLSKANKKQSGVTRTRRAEKDDWLFAEENFTNPADWLQFAEDDWRGERGPRGGHRWVNRKTGTKVYSQTNPGGTSTSGAQARKKEKRLSPTASSRESPEQPSVAQRAMSAMGRHGAAIGKAGHGLAAAAVNRLTSHVPEVIKAPLGNIWHALHGLLMAGNTATRALATEVSRGKGLSRADMSRLAKTLGAIDLSFQGAMMATAAASAPFAHELAIAAKAASYFPLASMAYILSSSASPKGAINTLKGALRLLREKFPGEIKGASRFAWGAIAHPLTPYGKTDHAVMFSEDVPHAQLVASAYAAATDKDWWLALFSAAFDDVRSVEQAVRMANDCIASGDAPESEERDQGI